MAGEAGRGRAVSKNHGERWDRISRVLRCTVFLAVFFYAGSSVSHETDIDWIDGHKIISQKPDPSQFEEAEISVEGYCSEYFTASVEICLGYFEEASRKAQEISIELPKEAVVPLAF